MTSMTETIDVATDPATAFSVFTDEFDQWWGHGPIDSYESWRLVERRIEPGVGGRLVEDYGDEQRVTGTITVWQPGVRLAWSTSSRVTVEVSFEAHADGTRVCVTGTVPDGVDGRSDLSMVRMAPQWFPRYLNRRARGEARQAYGRLHVGIRSAAPAATARWLADVFQLASTGDIPDAETDPDYTWIEFRVGNGFIVVWGGGGPVGSDSPLVYVEDLDSHCKHAEANGAEIVSPITEHGLRSYIAADCEGRQWVFAQSGPLIGR